MPTSFNRLPALEIDPPNKMRAAVNAARVAGVTNRNALANRQFELNERQVNALLPLREQALRSRASADDMRGEALRLEMAQAKAEDAWRGIMAVDAAPDDQKPLVYDMVRRQYVQKWQEDAAAIPETYDPAFIATAKAAGEGQFDDKGGFTLGANQTRFNARNEPVATGPTTTDPSRERQDRETQQARRMVQRFVAEQAKPGESTLDTITRLNQGNELLGGVGADFSQTFRDMWKKANRATYGAKDGDWQAFIDRQPAPEAQPQPQSTEPEPEGPGLLERIGSIFGGDEPEDGQQTATERLQQIAPGQPGSAENPLPPPTRDNPSVQAGAVYRITGSDGQERLYRWDPEAQDPNNPARKGAFVAIP